MKWLMLALLLPACVPVYAESLVEFGVYTKHWVTDDTDPRANLDNRLVGVSIDGWQVAGYNNSMGDDTFAIGYGLESYRDSGISYGVSAGGIYGYYSFALAYGWIPYVSPHVRIMYKGKGVTCRQMGEVSACSATFSFGG